jgi:hypothetical protein
MKQYIYNSSTGLYIQTLSKTPLVPGKQWKSYSKLPVKISRKQNNANLL